MNTRKRQNYVALEDSLPAGLETVNPNLAMIGEVFRIAADRRTRSYAVSFAFGNARSVNSSLLRHFEPGSGTYSVFARATAAGTFRWPADTGRADVRQPFLRSFAFEPMRHFRRITVVSAIVTIVLYRDHDFDLVPPLPDELEKAEVRDTLMLLDSRGREIAELASPEARAQIAEFARMRWEYGCRASPSPSKTIAFTNMPASTGGRSAAACHAQFEIGPSYFGWIDDHAAARKTCDLVPARSPQLDRTIYATICAWKIAATAGARNGSSTEYLNRSSYGNRRLGPEAAARAYFGKSARDLTLAESIYLAGLPQAPTRFNPWTTPERALRKYERSLARLAELDVITKEQHSCPCDSRRPLRAVRSAASRAAFCRCGSRAESNARARVRTSLDLDLQRTAEQLLRSHLATLNRYDITEAAMVIVENETGAVRAMVGSARFTRRTRSTAPPPLRSCGSTLKPFVYLNAIDHRTMTAATLLPDTQDTAFAMNTRITTRKISIIAISDRMRVCEKHSEIHSTFPRSSRSASSARVRHFMNCRNGASSFRAGSAITAPASSSATPRSGAGRSRGCLCRSARNGVAMPEKLLSAEHRPMARIASLEATEIINDILCDNSAREKSFGAHSPLTFEERVAVKTGTSSGFATRGRLVLTRNTRLRFGPEIPMDNRCAILLLFNPRRRYGRR